MITVRISYYKFPWKLAMSWRSAGSGSLDRVKLRPIRYARNELRIVTTRYQGADVPHVIISTEIGAQMDNHLCKIP